MSENKNFRKFVSKKGIVFLAGKNAENNDDLMKIFRNKDNIILHTNSPGSPFCVIEKLNPSRNEIYEAGVFCSSYSQSWKNNKKDVKINVFTGKDISKKFWMKKGTWRVKNAKTITIKRLDLLKFEELKNKNGSN